MNYPIRNNIGSFPSYLRLSEATIIDGVITAALNRHLTISVFDGEEWAVKKSANRDDIQKNVALSDETTLRLHNEEGRYKGCIWLVHGNGADVISDYSYSSLMEAIWNEVLPLCDEELYQ